MKNGKPVVRPLAISVGIEEYLADLWVRTQHISAKPDRYTVRQWDLFAQEWVVVGGKVTAIEAYRISQLVQSRLVVALTSGDCLEVVKSRRRTMSQSLDDQFSVEVQRSVKAYIAGLREWWE